MDFISAKPDFSNIPEEAIKELHRQGEICLQGTLQLALAADQRATTLAGILGAGSIALLAGVVTMISGAHPNLALVGAATSTAIFLYVGALLCAGAARPCDFFVAGYEPKRLAAAAQDETWILRYSAEDVQVRIDSNRASLVRASRLFTWGRLIALLAVPLGVIMFFSISLAASDHFFGMGHLAPVAAGEAPGVVAPAPVLARSVKPAD